VSFAKAIRIERSPRGYVSIRRFPGGELLAVEMQRLEKIALRTAKAAYRLCR
jgi:hypothetical protein